MGVVDFTKARGLVNILHGGPLGFKKLPILGRLQNLLLPLYFRGNVSLLCIGNFEKNGPVLHLFSCTVLDLQ